MEKTLPEGKFSLYASWVAMKNLIYYLINRSDQPSDRHDRSYIFFSTKQTSNSPWSQLGRLHQISAIESNINVDLLKCFVWVLHFLRFYISFKLFFSSLMEESLFYNYTSMSQYICTYSAKKHILGEPDYLYSMEGPSFGIFIKFKHLIVKHYRLHQIMMIKLVFHRS